MPKAPPKKAGNVLTQKVGPLPIWGWGVLIVGGVLVFRKMGAGKSTDTTAADQAAAQAAQDQAASQMYSGLASIPSAYDGTGGTGYTGGGVAGPPGPPGPPGPAGKPGGGGGGGGKHHTHYTSKSGDTLASIATKHHIPLATLEKLNPHLKKTGALAPGTVVVLS